MGTFEWMFCLALFLCLAPSFRVLSFLTVIISVVLFLVKYSKLRLQFSFVIKVLRLLFVGFNGHYYKNLQFITREKTWVITLLMVHPWPFPCMCVWMDSNERKLFAWCSSLLNKDVLNLIMSFLFLCRNKITMPLNCNM